MNSYSRYCNVVWGLVFAVAVAVPGTAAATNGYFSHGVSINEKSLAGAGAAYSQDTLAAASNPAGMVFQGNRFTTCAAVVICKGSEGKNAHSMAAALQLSVMQMALARSGVRELAENQCSSCR